MTMNAPPNMHVTKSDYETILSYYKIPFDNLSNKELKQTAENILATKLCKCIKAVERKVGTKNAIALCTSSVFEKKGLKYIDMSCRGRARLHPRKGATGRRRQLQLLAKTRKNFIYAK
jgi:hypothetical protein